MKKEVTGVLIALFLAAGFATQASAQMAIDLNDEQVENIVRRSYPYVALYNVSNDFALDDSGPMYIDGLTQSQKHTEGE